MCVWFEKDLCEAEQVEKLNLKLRYSVGLEGDQFNMIQKRRKMHNFPQFSKVMFIFLDQKRLVFEKLLNSFWLTSGEKQAQEKKRELNRKQTKNEECTSTRQEEINWNGMRRIYTSVNDAWYQSAPMPALFCSLTVERISNERCELK